MITVLDLAAKLLNVWLGMTQETAEKLLTFRVLSANEAQAYDQFYDYVYTMLIMRGDTSAMMGNMTTGDAINIQMAADGCNFYTMLWERKPVVLSDNALSFAKQLRYLVAVVAMATIDEAEYQKRINDALLFLSPAIDPQEILD